MKHWRPPQWYVLAIDAYLLFKVNSVSFICGFPEIEISNTVNQNSLHANSFNGTTLTFKVVWDICKHWNYQLVRAYPLRHRKLSQRHIIGWQLTKWHILPVRASLVSKVRNLSFVAFLILQFLVWETTIVCMQTFSLE